MGGRLLARYPVKNGTNPLNPDYSLNFFKFTYRNYLTYL